VNEKISNDAGAAKILSLAAETQFAPDGITSRTLLSTPNLRVIVFGFSKGQELTEHASTQQTLIEILSGECEFNLDGKSHTLKAGTLLFMPPNLRHAVKAKQPFSMLLTFVTPAGQTKASPEKSDGHR